MNGQQKLKWYGLVSLQDGKLWLWTTINKEEKPTPDKYKHWMSLYNEKTQKAKISESFDTEEKAESWCASFLPLHEKAYCGIPLNSKEQCFKNVKKRLIRIIDECDAQIEHYKREIEKTHALKEEVEKELEGYCKYLNEKIKGDL